MPYPIRPTPVFFTEAASHIEWIQWLDEKRHLTSLFGGNTQTILEESPDTLGRWLAGNFAKDHSDALFYIINKHEMNIHPRFWEILAREVAREVNKPWETNNLTRWLSLLLTTVPPKPDSDHLLWIGELCIEEGITDSLLDIFHLMCAVKLIVKGSPTFQDNPNPSTTAEVIQEHGQYKLNEIWEKGLKPKLNDVAEPLLAQLVDSFTAKHRTLCAWQAAGKDWDSDSYQRSAIEPHEQDTNPQSVDVLIDAARDSLEHLLATQPEITASWCDQLIRSDVPILRRLAVHTLNLRKDLTPNAKIDWVMNNISLHDQYAHHELFQIMRATYAKATSGQQRAIIEAVSKFDLPGRDGEHIAEIIAYEKFNWLTWLRDSDPNSNLTQKHTEEIQEQYPKFKPSPWADFTHHHHSSIRTVKPQSPWNVDQLLSKPAKEWADELLTFQNPDQFERDAYHRINIIDTIEKTANRNFQWGIELADTLAQLENWETDLWQPLMKSWASQQGEKEQDKVLDRMLQSELQILHARTIAETLTTLVNKGRLSNRSGLLSKANQTAIKTWENIDPDQWISPIEDWYSKAINHPAGILAEFWMHSLSSWYNQQDPQPTNISEEYLEFMQKILEDETTNGRLGRATIARQSRFLIEIDQEWAIEHLIPLLDSENREDRLAAWEGFLYDGINPRVAEILKGSFLRALAEMDELFPERTKSRDSFIDRLTDLLTYFIDQPLNQWIPMFFDKAEMRDKEIFARRIANNLEQMEPDSQKDLWNRWLRKYWENRLDGTPASLAPSEADTMIDWLPTLHNLFSEAVDIAIKMQNLPSHYMPPIHLLIQKGKSESHPEATAKLLIYWANQNPPRHSWYGGKEIIENIIEHDIPEYLHLKLSEAILKINW